MPQTFDQTIATQAITLVQAVPANQQTEYKSACEALSALLRRVGLARTLALLRSKKGAQSLLAAHIQQQFHLALGAPGDLLANHVQANIDTHRLHIELAQAVALWHKRMVQSLFGSPAPPAQPTEPVV